MFSLRKVALAIPFVFVILTATSQQQKPAKETKSEPNVGSTSEFSQYDFEALIRERDSLTTEIDRLNTDIFSLNDAISKREEFKKAKESKKPTDDIEKVIDGDLKDAQLSGTQYTDFENQRDIKRQSVLDKEKRKALIYAELVKRADIVGPQQKFKLNMSLIFAGLVGCVIIGFFVIASQDEQVRREIFSGQAGIQFVTLFSLVIAIILFGIIDVLEGKELAALLGGLSGYILGRSTSAPKGPSQPFTETSGKGGAADQSRGVV